MALPEQLQKQKEDIDNIYKQMTGDTQEGSETEADEGEEYVDIEATGDEGAQASDGEQSKDAEEGKETEDFAQKYKTLQGMYNAEVPRLHRQTKEQAQRLAEMEQLLSSIQQQQQKSSAPAPETKYVSEQDVEEYGDSIDVMRRVSREELVPVAQRLAQIEAALNNIQSSVVPQVNSVMQHQQASSEQMFWSQLSSAVPNWRDVNSDPDFQAWLLQIDSMTGITRQTYLEDAQRALDPHRVAAFFRTWLDSNQAPVAQTTGSANSELEKQVSPGRSKNTGGKQSNQAKVYTPDDIRKFFSDVQKGKYKGREKERDKIERDIFAAQRENRIQVA